LCNDIRKPELYQEVINKLDINLFDSIESLKLASANDMNVLGIPLRLAILITKEIGNFKDEDTLIMNTTNKLENELNGIEFDEPNFVFNQKDLENAAYVWQIKPFARGGCRLAFCGIKVKDPDQGMKLVIKKWIAEDIFDENFWDKEI